MANGKAKGSGFEREICKKLSVWVSGQEKPYVFWRMPASGGIATISEENKELSGDIVSMRPEGAFFTDAYSLECKIGYPKSSFDKHLKNNKNDEIKDFWRQACEDAERANKRPMLIYKKTNHPILVGIKLTEILRLPGKICDIASVILAFDAEEKLPTLSFFDFYEFFDIVTPNNIKGLKNAHNDDH